uniref:Uncharacterized protein n=1 Tax=Salix viminalis TaxID=40686 RepID=A0A6N2KC45_SALVM
MPLVFLMFRAICSPAIPFKKQASWLIPLQNKGSKYGFVVRANGKIQTFLKKTTPSLGFALDWYYN